MATCKNTADSHEQENMEGKAAASGNDVRTVGQPTGETAGAQSVWNITSTVMEERRVEETPLSTQEQAPQQVEEIPPNTWEQVLQRVSLERREVTGESSKCAGKAWQ